MTGDPGLVAVGIAEALGRHSLGDVACLLLCGTEPVDEREVLLVACQLLWDLASAHGHKVGRPAGEILRAFGWPAVQSGPNHDDEIGTAAPMPTTIKEILTTLRVDYADAVRLSAREEILADLAEDAVTARLHADTARFHQGSAHAYARAIQLILFMRGEEEDLNVHEAKQRARRATREADLVLMRCHGRRYRSWSRGASAIPGAAP